MFNTPIQNKARARKQAGGCKILEELNRKLIRNLRLHKIPALGFVVEGRLCDEKKEALAGLLRMWLDAGLELGNHSFSHFDLNNTPLAIYQADVIRGEATTACRLPDTYAGPQGLSWLHRW